MKSRCCDVTRGTHKPSTLLIASLDNSQKSVSNLLKWILPQQKSTKEYSVVSQSLWQLRTSKSGLQQPGRWTNSSTMKASLCRKLLPSWTQQDAARRPTSHRLPWEAKPRVHQSWSTSICHHYCLCAILEEEKCVRKENTQHLKLSFSASTPCPEAANHWLSCRARPQCRERITTPGHQQEPAKRQPRKQNTKYNHSINLWLWQRNKTSEMEK